jgi:NAD(P)-dependent dehydrogenase (short-subunit alcohol dehydrogenase family)
MIMDDRNYYALILGVSSGFGRECAIEFAKKGYNILGVHLDMGVAKKEVEEFGNALRQLGVKVQFYNVNAADDEKRKEVLDSIKEHFAGEKSPTLRVLIHSLAFGSIRPLFAESRDKMAGRKQLEMTMDVMANSLIYWTQDLFLDGLLAQNSRIFALTSIGSSRSMINYGAVSAAKAAIEAYIRQVAVELAPYKITANAILAGLTDTPAARKIPGFYEMLAHAKQHNPFNRNTVPTDVAKAISMLADEDFYWITGQVIGVDGGENILNFMG